MKFQILIPTYNRREDLEKNLEFLKCELLKSHLTNDFGIAVSDNASTDDTWPMLQSLKDEWKNEIELDILQNDTNVGLEQNAANLLLFATADYIVWLGDDDFLAEGYLSFIRAQFVGDDIGWMIPGLVEVNKDGSKTTGRPIEFPFKKFTAGYDAVYKWSHLAHQMSGLVVKRAGLLEAYMARPQWRNPYLFIFFTAFSQLHFSGVYAPSYQTLINNYNPKDWGYNKIGLLDEVFKSYYYLKEEIGHEKLNQLLLRFLVMHSYRINFQKGIAFVFTQGKWILNCIPDTRQFKFTLFKLLLKEYLVRKFR